MNVEVVATAVSGGLLVIGYTAKMVWDSMQRKGDVGSTPLANTATATKILKDTLESVDAQYQQTLERLDRLEAQHEQARRELDRERMIREAQAKRLDEHDREIGHIKRQFALAVTYIRSLLGFITEHGLEDQAPAPPSGLNLD